VNLDVVDATTWADEERDHEVLAKPTCGPSVRPKDVKTVTNRFHREGQLAINEAMCFELQPAFFGSCLCGFDLFCVHRFLRLRCCDEEIVASAKTTGKEKPHRTVGFLHHVKQKISAAR
jgi:hypothetical protein